MNVENKEMRNMIPQPLYTGAWGNCHIQGICVDKKKGYIYYSFTTKLVKATLDGKIIGSVDGLVGHLGCIAFNEKDGCVYGSLEYKNDIIGREILAKLGSTSVFDDGFYVVRFDVDKIDRVDMAADGADLMTAVYIREAVEDYNGFGKNIKGEQVPHKHGCSGIDGTTFGPLPGKGVEDGLYLYVAYGVYSDLEREDNDYQVLLCYDVADWDKVALPLKQDAMHKSGFEKPLHKFFVFTGNTNFGVQNLEYDPFSGAFYMAVYKGKKDIYPNYPLFAVDATVSAKWEKLRGMDFEGEVLTLLDAGEKDEKSGVRGFLFPFGSTGLYSFGDGQFLVCEKRKTTLGQCGYIFRYEFDGSTPFMMIG